MILLGKPTFSRLAATASSFSVQMNSRSGEKEKLEYVARVQMNARTGTMLSASQRGRIADRGRAHAFARRGANTPTLNRQVTP
jgi:hypothetical protein